jgi:plastocyanin
MNENRRRRLGIVVAGALVLSSLPILAAELPPGGTFLDDDGNVHEGFIEAIAAEGVTRGCNPPANDRFCPDERVSRGQMAAFLARALGLPAAGSSPFSDDAGSVFEDDIARLAAAGVTRGCNPPANDRFCPDESVTRGQMAAFLVRAFGYDDPGGGDLFVDDDGSVFERDIDRLATAGVTRGCDPPANQRFCPDEPVLRDQMASFLGRALGLTATVPPPRPTTTTSSTSTSTSTSTTSTSTSTSTTTPDDTFRFEMGAASFIPTSAVVSAPAEVRWRNESGVLHNLSSNQGPWPFPIDQNLPSGGPDFEVTLTTPGTYTFFCSIHPGMSGTVTVSG